MSEDLSNNDFGFSMTTEELIKKENIDAVSLLHEQVEKQKQKLVQLKNIIWPLLMQLRKDPDKDVIKWSNRAGVLNSLMRQIESILSD